MSYLTMCKTSEKILLNFGVIMILFLMATCAYAGTDGQELQPAAAKLQGLISGWGGKLICLSSLTLALIGSALRFNPYVVFGCIGVCLTTALGVSIINASVTALI